MSTLNDSFNSVPEKPSVGDRKVLGKERLKLLIGHECRECYEFYEALDDWTDEDIAKCMNKCSKHRAPKEQLDRDRLGHLIKVSWFQSTVDYLLTISYFSFYLMKFGLATTHLS